ncbi:hypothetical protein AVEN_157131-1 [Araneus ventricosus]|uniref:Uncharacterized protein n=1 Tax=Araneus ventricosus TaxID=182803 RepID=A0A4Y2UF98_ARAVE|nr:hypothetical protein AVEN_157131-1 [Araneus ventricosus]
MSPIASRQTQVPTNARPGIENGRYLDIERWRNILQSKQAEEMSRRDWIKIRTHCSIMGQLLDVAKRASLDVGATCPRSIQGENKGAESFRE